MNPKTPVIVGVGQVLNRSKDLEEAVEPILMMLDALDQAEKDAGVRLLSDVSSVRVIRGVWDYGDPAGYIAKNIGCDKAETKRGKEFYEWIIAELKYLTKSESSSTSSDTWITKEKTLEEVNEIDDIEKKLSKLKSLFEKKLITEEDYKEKKKEILDNM